MPVNTGFAHVSDLLFTTSIAVYALAMVIYAGEYAFGRRGRVAATVPAPQRVLVGVGAGSSSTTSSVTSTASSRAVTSVARSSTT